MESSNMKIEILHPVIVTPVDDEAVLINMANEEMYGLNSVAVRMWDSLQSTQDSDKTLQELLHYYDIDATILRHDLEQLIRDLENRKILRIITD